jgi:hypothetical protein
MKPMIDRIIVETNQRPLRRCTTGLLTGLATFVEIVPTGWEAPFTCGGSSDCDRGNPTLRAAGSDQSQSGIVEFEEFFAATTGALSNPKVCGL